MRLACTREPVVGKPVLQQIEIPESLYDDGHIHFVGRARRLYIQEKFGNKRSHDSKRDLQLPQSALKSTTTRIKPGASTRGIVKNLGQEQFGCLQRLAGASVPQLGVGQQGRSDGEVVVDFTGYRQGAGQLDDH